LVHQSGKPPIPRSIGNLQSAVNNVSIPRPDVVVCGGGRAGALAALVLARAGARVRVFERARFPRPKLCGDTVNPGALAVLRRHGIDHAAADGLPVAGMIVTALPDVVVEARYGGAVSGRSLPRALFDDRLLQEAARAGAEIEDGVLVQGPSFDGTRVDGLVVRGRDGRAIHQPARVAIAADGGASRLARGLGLARHAPRPRRWAVGVYFEGAHGATDCGEMHIRADRYVGVAPLPGGLTNVCVVTPVRDVLRDPGALVHDTLRTDPMLAPRFADARIVGRPVSLGPLAVDGRAAGVPGLLLAGDAAGFIDPMTGDGLRFALRGAELAAALALEALAHGWNAAHERLAAARRREFAAKWRFNRALRALVGSPALVRIAACGTRLSGAWLRYAVDYAGDLTGC
jgi:flavin-dependent dehydrogenase